MESPTQHFLVVDNGKYQSSMWKMFQVKGSVMQIEKALKNDRLRVSKVPWKFHILTIHNFAVISLWNLLFNSFCCLFLLINKTLRQKWMQKFQCLLFVLKRSYIYYYIICITEPLTIKTTERCHWLISDVFIVIFEYISYCSGTFLLMILSK